MVIIRINVFEDFLTYVEVGRITAFDHVNTLVGGHPLLDLLEGPVGSGQ